jgi:putative salt-induced outer membrane protein
VFSGSVYQRAARTPLIAAFLCDPPEKGKTATMKKMLLPIALIAILPLTAFADNDGSWSGSGEAGFAAARGNAKSENLNAKLQFKKEDDQWKDTFYLTALRSKGEVKIATVVGQPPNQQIVNVSSYNLTSNRYEAGASMGYKLDERSYIVGALRYENDDFSPFNYQWVASIGYGYTVLKNASDELSLEIGPGYKTYQPVDTLGPAIVNGMPVHNKFDSNSELVARGLMAYKHNFTESTSFVDTLLMEAGSDNTFFQNDAGLQVDMNKKLALKVGYQVRTNSDVAPGIKRTDQLVTTNLVYNLGG